VQPRRLYRSRDKQDCLARNVNLPDVCTANGAWTLRNAKQPVPFYLRAPLGRPFGLPLCPGLNGTSFFSVAAVTDFSVGAATDFSPRFGHFPLRVHVMFSAQDNAAQPWFNTIFPHHARSRVGEALVRTVAAYVII
jgi:hypothetical protein